MKVREGLQESARALIEELLEIRRSKNGTLEICVIDTHITFFLKPILNYLLLYIVIQKNDAHRVRTDQL